MVISVNNLSKRFGSNRALDDVSFQVDRGEVVGFLGPNGAGKSTTMRILTCFLAPDQGNIEIDNLSIFTDSEAIQKKIGYLPESAPLYLQMESLDYLRYIASLRQIDKSKIDERLKHVVRVCGLEKAIGRNIGVLSKGYRQRVGLAQALIHDPDILILDEPTSGLDPNQIIEIRNLIREIGREKTVMLSTHILQEVSATCSRVLIISDGKIVGSGTPEELVRQSQVHTTYNIAMRGDRNSIIEKLKTMSNFVSIEDHGTSKELHSFAIQLADLENRSEDLFRMAVDNGWILAELSPQHFSLEDVFTKLTKEGA